jgi:acyl-CoA hydrolase
MVTHYVFPMCVTYISAMCDCAFTNNTSIVCQNPRVTAINTCLEIDLTGQVCSDSLGTYMYSGM